MRMKETRRRFRGIIVFVHIFFAANVFLDSERMLASQVDDWFEIKLCSVEKEHQLAVSSVMNVIQAY